MVEHLLALGLLEQSLGSSGCSKKHQGSPRPLNLIWMMCETTISRRSNKLSLSVSTLSWGRSTGRPQQSGSFRPSQDTPGPTVWTTPCPLNFSIPRMSAKLIIELTLKDVMVRLSPNVKSKKVVLEIWLHSCQSRV